MARLVKTSRGLRAVFSALFSSLPALWNVGAFLLLITFVYAIVGVAIFGEVLPSSSSSAPPLEYIAADRINFAHFGHAMLSLFVMSTGEQWHLVMRDLAQRSGCGPKEEMGAAGDDDDIPCGSLFAYPYMITYVFCVSFVLLQIFVAVTTQQLTAAIRKSEYTFGQDHLMRMKAVWEEFDPRGTCTISLEQLVPFLRAAGPGVAGVELFSNRVDALRYVRRLAVPVARGRIHYAHLARCLAEDHFARRSGGDLSVFRIPHNAPIMRRIHSLQARAFPELRRGTATAASNLAALYVQQFFRNARRARKQPKS
jgi:hypothetical protein